MSCQPIPKFLLSFMVLLERTDRILEIRAGQTVQINLTAPESHRYQIPA
jgi:hypothetical protein